MVVFNVHYLAPLFDTSVLPFSWRRLLTVRIFPLMTARVPACTAQTGHLSPLCERRTDTACCSIDVWAALHLVNLFKRRMCIGACVYSQSRCSLMP